MLPARAQSNKAIHPNQSGLPSLGTPGGRGAVTCANWLTEERSKPQPRLSMAIETIRGFRSLCIQTCSDFSSPIVEKARSRCFAILTWPSSGISPTGPRFCICGMRAYACRTERAHVAPLRFDCHPLIVMSPPGELTVTCAQHKAADLTCCVPGNSTSFHGCLALIPLGATRRRLRNGINLSSEEPATAHKHWKGQPASRSAKVLHSGSDAPRRRPEARADRGRIQETGIAAWPSYGIGRATALPCMGKACCIHTDNRQQLNDSMTKGQN